MVEQSEFRTFIRRLWWGGGLANSSRRGDTGVVMFCGVRTARILQGNVRRHQLDERCRSNGSLCKNLCLTVARRTGGPSCSRKAQNFEMSTVVVTQHRWCQVTWRIAAAKAPMNPSRDVPCGRHAAVAHHHLRAWSVGHAAFRGFGPGLKGFGDWGFRVQGFPAPGFSQPKGL